ncbi:MAG: EAL domain-containing protein, partial [Porticoccaceae bacterium]|nr:EAL domain-containing protein [Porticoccaceae bacterium]
EELVAETNPAQRDYELEELFIEAARDNAFEFYYQPKVHLPSATVSSAEALLRWHTKSRKVMVPSQFIDTAERNPVIRPITWWAIKSAVATLSRWSPELSLSVNITPTLLLDDEIVSVVQDALDIFAIDPSRLLLEVTENVMVDNQDIVLKQLARLRKIGIKVSIDDFGTGYSSLSYFRDLPADELKIDKHFVIQMLGSQKDLSIVKTVINLAHNFSLKVVAEGVENKACAVRLKEMGCDILQGVYYDPPLPAEEFEQRYRPTQ